MPCLFCFSCWSPTPTPHCPGSGSPREHRKGVLCTQEGVYTHTHLTVPTRTIFSFLTSTQEHYFLNEIACDLWWPANTLLPGVMERAI